MKVISSHKNKYSKNLLKYRTQVNLLRYCPPLKSGNPRKKDWETLSGEGNDYVEAGKYILRGGVISSLGTGGAAICQ